ncbi:hypothetical protein Zmor_004179 [Zophobas morio]|uniref:Reverse transcriptase domain-containing protein n=1 Tax=Zophobas morio TaxID=2755281 RepID=A0AA38HKY4_9CUCU|nr:hypothetical protein Zmor_004179 [Zophobas morio]
MAFADDFVLLEEEERRVPNTLAAVEGFFRARGMEVNPRKSVGLCVRGYEGRSIPRVQPVFRIGGQWIRPIKAMDSFRYLGHQVGSFGVKRPNLHALQMMLERVHRAPLKPDQKLSVLRQYLIPRLLYGFQNPGVTGGLLTAADRLIKRFVKRVLHFNIHTPDAVIHAAARYGGLGVYCLRSGVPFTFYRRLDRLGREGDPVIRAVMASPRVARLVSRIRQLAGDVPPDQVWKERLHAGQMTAGLRSASGDPASSAWLRARPHGWASRNSGNDACLPPFLYFRPLILTLACLPPVDRGSYIGRGSNPNICGPNIWPASGVRPSGSETTAKGTGLEKLAGKEDPVELDSSLAL